MKKLVQAVIWFWDKLPFILLTAAAGFVFGALVQGSHMAAIHEAELQTLRSQQLAKDLAAAKQRAADRRDYIKRLSEQVEKSNAQQRQDATRYADLQRTLDRMRDDQATAELYLRATAESAAARAATAEKLFGDCRREYAEMARRAGLHALDLQDALVH